MIKEKHREPGTICSVQYDDERANTFYIHVKLVSGMHQAMGGRHLPDTREACMQEIRALFGVKTDAELVGRTCYVLRNFTSWDASIEGFEVDGKRWTWRDYIRRTFGKDKSPLDEEKESLRRSIHSAAQSIETLVANLDTIESDFVDWDKR